MIMKPETCNTIEKFINSDHGMFTYSNLSLFEKDKNDNVLLTYNLLNEYYDILQDYAVEVTLTDKEYIKYKYKPKLLSYDLYGTTELFFVIFTLNNICNVKDFDFKTIKLLRASDMKILLSAIYNNEHDTIINNRTEFDKK